MKKKNKVVSEASYATQRELDAIKRIPRRLASSALNRLTPNMLARTELANLASAGRNIGNRATPLLGIDTILNTRAQEQGAADFQRRSGGVRQGELYRASDLDSKGAPKPGAKMQLGAIEAAARGQTANKDSKSSLNQQTPPVAAKPIERKVIDAKNIAGRQQKVTTNKAYDAKLGGYKASVTYGDKGQRMIRANIGNAGVNRVAKGEAKVGQSYGATLNGVKGTVKYDAKGNRSFQALQKPTTSN